MNSLPSYEELKSSFPISFRQEAFIQKSRQTVRAILNGEDKRLLLIVGPCSIHDRSSAKEYAKQLKSLADEVSSFFFLVMRTYCEKPRTGFGWKGLLYDPHLDGTDNIKLGIQWTRELMLNLADMEVPAATEFLDPFTAYYYDDLVTWGSIGARTGSSQTHRQLASDLSMPVGFKNCVAGNISSAINGALAASFPNTFVRLSETGKPVIQHSKGNKDVHIVLRGGESGPNYDPATVFETLANLKKTKLPPRLLIDCSHHNSGKKEGQQSIVFQSVIHQMIKGNSNIRGLMLESHLFAGNQRLMNNPSSLQYGVSITDPCLDWNSTSQLLSWGTEHLKQQFSTSASENSQYCLIT